MEKTKVLILTYYWPPTGGAGVQRWLKFVKYLSELQYDLHVYTPENPEAPSFDESLITDIPESIKVIKTTIWEPFAYYKKLTKKKGQFNAGFLSEEDSNKQSWAEKFSMFIRANVFIPDAKMFWIRPSVRFLNQYVRDENIDLIISSGPPHSLHIIAQKVKKNTSIKWLADFRDPWTNIDFYKDLPITKRADRYQKKLEKSVLNEADQIVVVGEQMKKEFLKLNRESNIEVITNGYDSEMALHTSLDKEFSILHVGSINSDRSHESFYQALSELVQENLALKETLRLKFIGKVDFLARGYISKYELEPLTIFTTYLPYSEISDIQCKAHLLYLPINNSPNAKGILTGKFFEYLAARRPILCQGPVDGDVSSILKETKAGQIFDFKDKDGIKKEILKQFAHYQKGNDDFESKGIENYSRKNLTKQLDRLISKLNQ